MRATDLGAGASRETIMAALDAGNAAFLLERDLALGRAQQAAYNATIWRRRGR